MIKIRNVQHKAQSISFTKVLGDEREVGSVVIKNDRRERYHKYDVVDIDYNGIEYQYIIDTDQVRGLGNNLYEHTILLSELIDRFEVVDVTSRGVYPRGNGIATIGDIINKYKRELQFYRNLFIDTIQGDWLDVRTVQMEFDGMNLKQVLMKLFRIINATPKLLFENGIWKIYPQKWSYRRNLVEPHKSTYYQEADSVTYATKIKAQVKNSIYDNVQPSTYPSPNGWILPRAKNIIRSESELEYKLDSDIVALLKVEIIDVEFEYDDGNTIQIENETINITEHVVTQEEFDALETGALFDVSAGFVKAKQNHIRYNLGNNTIFGLYEQDDVGIFNTTIRYLEWAVRYQIGKLPQYDISQVQNILTDIREFKMRVEYIRQRDLDIIINKHNSNNMNVATELYNQKASIVELSQLKSNLATLSDRSGTDKETYSRTYDIGQEVDDIGDYTSDGRVITKAKFTLENNFILAEYEINQNFASIDQEYQFKYELNPFTITEKRLNTNPIQEVYMVAGRTLREPNSILTEKGRNSVLDILTTDNLDAHKAEYAMYQSEPVNYEPNEFIHMPIQEGGGARSISLHASFRKNIIAGWKFDEIDGNLVQQPIIYKYEENGNFELPDFNLYIGYGVEFEDDGTYPLFTETQDMIDNRLTEIETKPIDLGINDALGYTLMIHAMSDDDRIIIGKAFSEYNHIVREVRETDLKLYTSDRPYNLMDETPRENDVEGNGIFSFDKNLRRLEVVTESDFWAIAKELDGQERILVAGNRVYNIFFNFENIDTTSFSAGKVVSYNLSNTVDMSLDFNYERSLDKTYDLSHTVNTSVILEYNKVEYKEYDIKHTASVSVNFNYTTQKETKKNYNLSNQANVSLSFNYTPQKGTGNNYNLSNQSSVSLNFHYTSSKFPEPITYKLEQTASVSIDFNYEGTVGTAPPTIISATSGINNIIVEVRNEDSDSADILLGFDENTNDEVISNLASGSSTSVFMPYSGATPTKVYARAVSSGKLVSLLVSKNID